MARKLSRRLTKTDWLQAGFEALATDGPEALKAEPLARRLGTTKGSFYWHFADVPDFHGALLSAWEVQAVGDVVTALTEEARPVAKLRRLGQVISEDPAGRILDPAVRAWARGNTHAAETVTRVDKKRITYLKDLLAELGIGNPEMARIIYASGIGMCELGRPAKGQNAGAMGSLVDLVLALR